MIKRKQFSRTFKGVLKKQFRRERLLKTRQRKTVESLDSLPEFDMVPTR